MAAEPITTYRVHFRSEHALRSARARLQEDGFAVTDVTGEAVLALDARLGTQEKDAAVRLQTALAQVDHDPLIEYQDERLEFFSR
jgi:hypothetical protein